MTHVIGLSGGKDSTAMALWLSDKEPRDYEYICNETGNELPEMTAHWDWLETVLGASIKRVRHTVNLIDACRHEKMLPNVFSRWCTRILKIEPTIRYFESLSDDSVLYVGLRADEPMRRGIFGEEMNVRFPLRELNWNEADVWKYLATQPVTIPKRTDCALCPYQRLGEWRDLYFQQPEMYAQGVALEKEFKHTLRSPGRDTWPADLESLAKEFDRSRPLREHKRSEFCRVCSL